MTASFRALCTLILLCTYSTHSFGEDWPMRGRDWTRNAVSPEKNPPIDWEIDDRNGNSRNILWSAKLGSVSCGDPVIADGLLWVGTNNRYPRDEREDDDASVLMCFREKDGEFLYQYVSPRLEDPIRYDWGSSSLASSPLIDGDRLWFCTNRCETICLDIGPLRDKTAEPTVAWKVDMREKLGVVPRGVMIGCNANHCSIAAYEELIYVNTNNARYGTSVTAPDAPSLVCFNQNTGEVVWTDNSPGADILDVQFGSPLVAVVEGRPQVIMGQGDGWLRSFDCRTGELIWKFDINDTCPERGQPFRAGGHLNYFVATPVFYNDRIYIAGGRHSEVGFGAGRLCCIDATKKGDVSSVLDGGAGKSVPNPNSGLVWEFTSRGEDFWDTMHCSMSSVAVDDSLVIAPDAEGLIHCLDAESGEKYWTHDTLSQIHGSPLIVDGRVFVGGDSDFHVLELSRTRNVLTEYPMPNRVETAPAFANGVLYLATKNTLYAISNLENLGE